MWDLRMWDLRMWDLLFVRESNPTFLASRPAPGLLPPGGTPKLKSHFPPVPLLVRADLRLFQKCSSAEVAVERPEKSGMDVTGGRGGDAVA